MPSILPSLCAPLYVEWHARIPERVLSAVHDHDRVGNFKVISLYGRKEENVKVGEIGPAERIKEKTKGNLRNGVFWLTIKVLW
jgi:hypothetical protein